MPRSLEVGDIDIAIGGVDGLIEGQANGMYDSIGSVAIGGMGCRLSLIGSDDDSLRVYTSYPALTRKLLSERGYNVESIEQRGGKLEAYPMSRNCNAIVDIIETGNTIKANNLVEQDVLIEDIPLAVMFRSKPVPSFVRNFAPWQIQNASKVLSERKEQFDKGVEVDTTRKNTLLLLSDKNRLIKAFGEEQAEFIAAITSGDNVVGEANDVLWVLLTAVLQSGATLNEVWAEYCKRNTKPSKSIKE